MSNQTESNSNVDAAPQQDRQQTTGEALQDATTTTYLAPHHRHEECRVPGIYLVEFRRGHTIAKHFEFLGREFELTALDSGYFANMDDQLLNNVRRDPRVEFVEDDFVGSWV